MHSQSLLLILPADYKSTGLRLLSPIYSALSGLDQLPPDSASGHPEIFAKFAGDAQRALAYFDAWIDGCVSKPLSTGKPITPDTKCEEPTAAK